VEEEEEEAEEEEDKDVKGDGKRRGMKRIAQEEDERNRG
jgi:hypothetical protein